MLPRNLQNKEALRVALADWRLWAVLVFIGAAGRLLTVYASGSETSGSPIVINGTAVPPAPVLKPESVRRGQMIYTKFCANCHGQNLEGAPEASDGEMVKQLILEHRPDVVILDVRMPGATGIEVARWVREQGLPLKVAKQ